MKNKLFTIGLPLIIAVCIFIGCASMGGGETAPPGTLTITGIPAEFEGKFVDAEIWSIPKFNDKGQPSGISQTVVSAEPTAVTNGEVKLPLYTKGFKRNGYAGSDTLDVRLRISDRTGEDLRLASSFSLLSRAAIASVAFEGGVAEAKWTNAIKAGYITVTNIPETYKEILTIQVGQGFKNMPLIGGVFETQIAYGDGSIRDGKATVPVLSGRKESGFTPFPESGTMDIMVSSFPSSSSSAVTKADVFLFKDVQIRNGKADLDFRRGGKR